MNSASQTPEISIVVPVFNEEECARELASRVKSVMLSITDDYEMIFVDDCSKDRTIEIIRHLAEDDPRVRGAAFSRNMGHQAAIACGLDLAKGRAVITMDGDLQHPPEMLPRLVEEWRNGADIVNTVKQTVEGQGHLERLLSRSFYAIFSRISEVSLTPQSSDFRLMDRKAVTALQGMGEFFKFYRGMVHYIGFRHATVAFDCPPRFAGSRSYTLKKSLRLASDGIFSFSTFGLKVPFYAGLAVLLLVLIYFFVSIVLVVTGVLIAERGWMSIVGLILLTFSAQLIFMGVLGIYISKVFIEVKRRPTYFVREVIGRDVET